ncbi:YkgJ family cysteine cluster protein [Methanolobus sp. ZRKC3]|uniref:YkgJ family cysteine cluster protein n=1 Tax=Methanolobus sp. ZRKC3 TaxID=3125786 RepID=UPI00324847F3
MSETYKAALIRNLQMELDAAKKIDVKEIAAAIRDYGFTCLICGRCCRREYGDNTVIVSPEEIEKIQHSTSLDRDHIAVPLIEEREDGKFDEAYLKDISDSIDSKGSVHTFGWKLCQKDSGDCSFIQKRGEGNRCTIYSSRPMLCSTYPFYMEDMEMKASHCEGLGREISHEQSRELAENVLIRYLAEIEDTIRLYEKYDEFERSNDALDKALANLGNGYINYVLHDSTGKHNIKQKVKDI